MLNGNLDTFALPDVLRFIASGSVTGRVEITRDDVVGELRARGGLVPAERLAVVADVLLVERRLRPARRELAGRPEP